MASAPKVFVSHTSDDKEKWVIPLASRLRERGIDAWVDQWEIKPGDSIVQKVFSQGMEEADAIVVVLSRVSVTKPWVHAELDVAVVKNIEKLVRLIPVKVDDCVVPTALSAKLHLSIEKYGSIESIADEIVDTMHGVSKAPPIGKPPSYVMKAAIQLPGISKVDSLVLEQICALGPSTHGFFRAFEQLVNSLPDMTTDQVFDSIDILLSQGYLYAAERVMKGQVVFVKISPSSVLMIAGAKGEDVKKVQCQLASALIAADRNMVDLDSFAASNEITPQLVWAVAADWDSRGVASLIQTGGPALGWSWLKVPAPLKRWATENCG